MVRSRYPGISGEQLIGILKKIYGLTIISQKGSNVKVLCNQKKTIIPHHRKLAYGTFSAILSQLSIDEEDFLDKL